MMRVARRVRAIVLTAAVAALLMPGAPARAAFPGENGVIAFESQSVAGDHTQTDVIEVENDQGTRFFRCRS